MNFIFWRIDTWWYWQTNKQTNQWYSYCKILGSQSSVSHNSDILEHSTILGKEGGATLPDIAEKHHALIFGVKRPTVTSWAARTWKWRHYIPHSPNTIRQCHIPNNPNFQHCICLAVNTTSYRLLTTSITSKDFTVEISVILCNFKVWCIFRAKVKIKKATPHTHTHKHTHIQKYFKCFDKYQLS